MIKNRENMLKMLDVMLDEDVDYNKRLEAYEFLLEDCEELVDDMLAKLYSLEGETGKMLMEVLAGYKGNKAIFMGLVSYLYKGEDVALFARLIGSYGDENGIQVLKTFCDEYEPNYNEYMEIRNAVEELGGDFDLKQDFTDDPLYRYLKGLDEPEEDSRRSPFEDLFRPRRESEEFEDDSEDELGDVDDELGAYEDDEDECDDCDCHHDDCQHEHCDCHDGE